jgi:6-phosphogluconolactonase (cycloisomerase 2 family)
MTSPRRIASAAALTAAALATFAFTAASASASTATVHGGYYGASNAVFVQTDNTAGNQVVAYTRAADGTLTLAGTYNTGGLGGQLTGSVVDHTASEGSLVYDSAHGLLYAVNAGSNTLSVFAASGDQLLLRQVISTGGTFPVSVAVHGNLVYVVNALRGGSVNGYWVSNGRLSHVPGSRRALHLKPNASPQFVNTPGQVAFSRSGSQLIVTTKANGSDIDVFGVASDGTLSASPVVNSEPNAVPFGIAYNPAGDLVIAEAGPNALATFTLNANGTVTLIDQADNKQAATCWVTSSKQALFASNAGSADVSDYTSSAAGQLKLTGETSTDPGTVDSSATPSGRYLYVQTGGNGIVDEFAVGAGASLTEIGSVTVPGAAGGEGIVAF